MIHGRVSLPWTDLRDRGSPAGGPGAVAASSTGGVMRRVGVAGTGNLFETEAFSYLLEGFFHEFAHDGGYAGVLTVLRRERPTTRDWSPTYR